MFVEYKSSESTVAAVCPPGPVGQDSVSALSFPHTVRIRGSKACASASLAALNLSAEREGEIGNGCVCLVPE